MTEVAQIKEAIRILKQDKCVMCGRKVNGSKCYSPDLHCRECYIKHCGKS